MTDVTFDETVKRLKAVEWLIENDAVVRAASHKMAESVTSAVLIAADYGEAIKIKVDSVASRMVVTDQERAEGYPLPVDDNERRERLKTIESMRKFKA